MPSTASGTATLSSHPLLSGWLGDAVPPTAELAYEALQAIARCADVIGGWRPQESQWPTISSIARDECAQLDLMSGAHSSSLAPSHANAMFGDFRNWPLYSSLVAGAANPTDTTWSFVASLVAWSCLGANVAGMHVGSIAQSHSLALQTWLRESLRNPDLLATMSRLLGEATSPRHILLALNAPKGPETKLWGALKAHARAYCTSYPDTLMIPAPTAGEEATTEGLPLAIRKIIDHSVALAPENEGLAPDDAGAVRYVSQDVADEDVTTDALTRHRVRCLASAREFNHLPLHWASLNQGERRVLREVLQAALQSTASRTGAVAIAMCALLALSPADVSALRIHSTMAEAIAALTTVSTSLVWIDDQLIALQGVPQPECAYRAKDGVLLLPHRAYKAVGAHPELTHFWR